MVKIKFKNELEKKHYQLSLFVLGMTILVVIFSTYMSSSFLTGLGVSLFSKAMFFCLGVFMELAKICAGITIIFAISIKKTQLRNISIFVLIIFSVVSMFSSTATISNQMSSAQEQAENKSESIIKINHDIKNQQFIVDHLISSQAKDFAAGYRTRANSMFDKIKVEQNKLDMLFNLKITHQSETLSVPVINIFNSLIPLGHQIWQKIVVL